MRLRTFSLVSAFALRHATAVIWIRMLTGSWLVVLTLILCQAGYWWGLALVPISGLHFYLAHRLNEAAKARRDRLPPFGSPPTASG